MKTTDKQYNKFNTDYSKNRDTYDYICDQDFYEMINFEIKGKNLLDIGCGNGDDLLQFKKLGAEVFGVEPSKEFIEEIKLKKLEVRNGVGEDLPFKDNSFDIVVSKYAIQTSTQVKECLLEASRVLKKDGILHILVKHPMRQFLEKRKYKNKPINYFKQEITKSLIYNGKIMLEEPTHSMEDYFNSNFFSNFDLIDYRENFDFPASEQINGDIYPTYFVLTARKK